MKALVYRGPGALVVEERPKPHAGEGEVVLHVDACSICGTDLRIASGAHRAYANGLGRVPGHEVVGTVVEVGGDVGAKLGEQVFVAPNYGCGHCRACRRGLVNLCEDLRAIGITEDGAFAEYMLLRRDLVAQGNLIKLAPGVDPDEAALAEPLACALRGSRACHTSEEDIVVVYGAGPIGLFHVCLARLAGAAAIIVCEPNAERRERALGFGATEAFGTDFGELRRAVGHDGADVVIVATSVASAQREALQLAATSGRVNFFAGLPRDRSSVELDTNLVHYKELVVTGTTGSTNESCRAALDLITDGQLKTAPLISARMGLASAQKAFDLAGSGQALKVVIEP